MKQSDTTRFPERFTRRQVLFWLSLLAALTSVAAYYKMLTGRTPFDDEGTLMLTVQQSLAGKKLYAQVLSIYGPLYYAYNFAVRALTGTPVTHDVTRISSVFPWLACALLSSVIILRLTRSLVFAAAGFYLLSKALEFFQAEPGHTHEITLVILCGLLACPLSRRLAARPRLLMTTLGCLAGALLLVKVNIGIFVLAAIAITIVAAMPPGLVGRSLGILAGIGCILVPPMLMRNHLNAGWAASYCVLTMVSISAAVICLLRFSRPAAATFRDAIYVAAGCAVTVALGLAWLALQGTSLALVFDSLVLLPSRVIVEGRNWYIGPRFSPFWIIWGALGLALATFTTRRTSSGAFAAETLLLPLKTVFAVATLWAVSLHIDLLPFAVPFVWLVLYNPDPERRESQALSRSLLCSVAVIQSLYGYPVYGSQGYVIQIVPLIAVIVCGGDVLFAIVEQGYGARWLEARGRSYALVILAGITLLLGKFALDRYENYHSLPPLDLPGSHRLHVDPQQRQELRTLVAQMTASCDSFEGLPGLPSLNFWTGLKPLTGYNLQCWTLYLSEAQQNKIIQALSEHSRACMVYNPTLAAAWNPGGLQDLESLPLVRYMRQSFKPVMSSGEYQFLVRKERPWPAAGN